MVGSTKSLLARDDVFQRAASNPRGHSLMGLAVFLLSGIAFGLYNWLQNSRVIDAPSIGLFILGGVITIVFLHWLITVVLWTIGRAFGRGCSFLGTASATRLAAPILCLSLIAVDLVVMRGELPARDPAVTVEVLALTALMTLFAFARTLMVAAGMGIWRASIASAWLLLCIGSVINVVAKL